MRTIGGGKGAWLAGVLMVWLGACAGVDQDKTPTDSAARAQSMTAPLPPVTDYGHCGEPNGTDCQGGLPGLRSGWEGNGQVGQVLHDTIAARFASRPFVEGSQVALPRKAKSGRSIWTRVDAIEDAHKVFLGAIQYPVIMARFEVIRGNPNDEDNRFGAKRDQQKSYYFVANPDSWDGATDSSSYWAVVAYDRTRRQAIIVAAGSRLRPCTDGDGKPHQQKPAAFATFTSCPISSFGFESLMAWKGVIAADSSKGLSIMSTLPPDVQTALRLAGENDDPLWITCGLGCCSTEM